MLHATSNFGRPPREVLRDIVLILDVRIRGPWATAFKAGLASVMLSGYRKVDIVLQSNGRGALDSPFYPYKSLLASAP